jgi:hypothetical protein
MGKYLFPNFLNDQQEYERAEALWRDRWNELVRRLGQEWLWNSPWLNTTFADGTPCRDGNPIFSAVCPQRRLGVHVIQLEPSENPKEFYVWTDTFAEGSPEAVKELVISCALTCATLDEAAELMRQWITEEKIPRPSEPYDGPVSPNTSGTLPAPALSDRSPPSST